eukprot:SAG11_NODE_4524_length_1864_cov_2.954674_1_plen_132_part_00
MHLQMMPNKSMLWMAPFLGGGGMLLMGTGIYGVPLLRLVANRRLSTFLWDSWLFLSALAGLFFGLSFAMTNVMLGGFLALFTGFVAFDTQNAIAAYEEGERDHVKYAADFFLNFISLFRVLLSLLGINSNE